MKIIRPNAAPARDSGGGSGTPRRGKWFKEWIDNQPKFVELACGHKIDIKLRGVTLRHIGIVVTDVLCERCDSFHAIVKAITLMDYHGLPPAPEIPDEPPF